MAGVGSPYLPFYATAYGDSFGYNERANSNVGDFRNRYFNTWYSGTSRQQQPQQSLQPHPPSSGCRPCTVPTGCDGSEKRAIVAAPPCSAPLSKPQIHCAASCDTQCGPDSSGLPTIKPKQLASSACAASVANFAAIYRPVTVTYQRPGLSYEKIQANLHNGKESISRRLPENTRLRYHLPGYMGFVRSLQFRHGSTYGKTTRKAICDQPV